MLCEISLDNGLEQLVESPTRGSNALDLIFTNTSSLLREVEVVDSIPGTDHDTVLDSIFPFLGRVGEAPECDKLAKRPRGHVITGGLVTVRTETICA